MDTSRAMGVPKSFEAGLVSINCTPPILVADMPFGGYKGSSQGLEGYGHSSDEHLKIKQ